MMRTRIATSAGTSPASAPMPIETIMPTMTAVNGTCGAVMPWNTVSPTIGALRTRTAMSTPMPPASVVATTLSIITEKKIRLLVAPKERRMPHLIDGSRRKRIAAGSGTTIQQVNQLLSARKQMEKMMKQMGKGKMPSLPELTKAGRR